jgi:putative flippase GtrA
VPSKALAQEISIVGRSFSGIMPARPGSALGLKPSLAVEPSVWSFRALKFFPFYHRRTIAHRIVCFGCVGAVGMGVNLLAYNPLIAVAGVTVASAVANVVSNAGNYVLNNFWTFHDRRRTGLRFVSGYASYFLCSSLAMVATVVIVWFANHHLTPLLFHTARLPRTTAGRLAANGYQAGAVLLGSLLSFKLNLNVTWGRDAGEPELTELKLQEAAKPSEAPAPANSKRLRPAAPQWPRAYPER